jgi:hypothetical protein
LSNNLVCRLLPKLSHFFLFLWDNIFHDIFQTLKSHKTKYGCNEMNAFIQNILQVGSLLHHSLLPLSWVGFSDLNYTYILHWQFYCVTFHIILQPQFFYMNWQVHRYLMDCCVVHYCNTHKLLITACAQ